MVQPDDNSEAIVRAVRAQSLNQGRPSVAGHSSLDVSSFAATASREWTISLRSTRSVW